MNDFLKMDIFFFVATLAIVLLTGVTLFVAWRIARILRHIEHISEQASFESDRIRADLAEVRAGILRGKGLVKSLSNVFGIGVKRASKKV